MMDFTLKMMDFTLKMMDFQVFKQQQEQKYAVKGTGVRDLDYEGGTKGNAGGAGVFEIKIDDLIPKMMVLC